MLSAHGQCWRHRTRLRHSPDATSVDSIDDLAYLYLDLLAEGNLRDAVVIGSSLGGWIAAEMAVRSTERLRGLVLVRRSASR